MSLLQYILGDFVFQFFAFSAVVGLLLSLVYYRSFRDREMRAAHLEATLASAQLDALRVQLRPHFLFNTLNSIAALIHIDPDAADEMLGRLSELLRMTLERDGATGGHARRRTSDARPLPRDHARPVSRPPPRRDRGHAGRRGAAKCRTSSCSRCSKTRSSTASTACKAPVRCSSRQRHGRHVGALGRRPRPGPRRGRSGAGGYRSFERAPPPRDALRARRVARTRLVDRRGAHRARRASPPVRPRRREPLLGRHRRRRTARPRTRPRDACTVRRDPGDRIVR